MIRLLQINGKFPTINNKLLVSREGLYTTAWINHLIKNEGYIPVASGAELNALRNNVNQPMGVGTLWRGDYTTGLDKKYVQVKHIDVNYSFSILTPFAGIYDGNMLTTWRLPNQMFSTTSSASIELRNIICQLADIPNSSAPERAVLVGTIASANCIIEDCSVSGKITTTAYVAGGRRAGIVAAVSGTGLVINRCYANIEIIGGAQVNAGIVGDNLNGSGLEINDCFAIVDFSSSLNGVQVVGSIVGWVRANNTIINSPTGKLILNIPTSTGDGYIGGIGGYQQGASSPSGCQTNWAYSEIIADCDSSSTAYKSIGGTWGLNRNASQINNSYASGSIVNTGSGTRLAGGIAPDNANSFINNSYARLTSMTAGTRVGIANSGTVTNSYYDKDILGWTGGLGQARTTAQMKAGTASSFILPDGTIDPDSLAANAMYTAWDTAIWDFLTTNDYPILK